MTPWDFRLVLCIIFWGESGSVWGPAVELQALGASPGVGVGSPPLVAPRAEFCGHRWLLHRPCSRWVCSRSSGLWSPRGGQTQGAGWGRQCRAQLPPCQLLVTLNICYLFQCFFIFIKYLAKNHLCGCQTLGEQPRVAAVTLNVGFVDPFLFCSWFLERWEEGDQQHLKGASQPFPDGYGQE